MTFEIHTKETAPKDSKHLLDNSQKAFGMIPNTHGVLAEAPMALEAYQLLDEFSQRNSFNAAELTVV